MGKPRSSILDIHGRVLSVHPGRPAASRWQPFRQVLASEPGKAPFPPGPLRGSDDSPGPGVVAWGVVGKAATSVDLCGSEPGLFGLRGFKEQKEEPPIFGGPTPKGFKGTKGETTNFRSNPPKHT